MMDSNMSEEAYRASRVHKSMGNPLRYRMLDLVAEIDEISTRMLSKRLNRKIESIDYHVEKMKDLDLIYSEKQGKESLLHIKRWDLYHDIKGFEGLFNREEN